MIEVEKKAWLKAPGVIEKIKGMAAYAGEMEKEDIYFAPITTERLNIYKDPIFRVRIQNGQKLLSYKKKNFRDKTEVNEEFEQDISSIDLSFLRPFFQYLGFFPFIEKKKTTHLYRLEDFKGFAVCIEVNLIENLGEFVEIEILADREDQVSNADAAIGEIFALLSIPDEDIEARYYIDLLMEREA